MYAQAALDLKRRDALFLWAYGPKSRRRGADSAGGEWFAQPGECLCATYYFGWQLAAPETAGELAFLAGVAVVETLIGRRGDEEGNREQGTGNSVGAQFIAPDTQSTIGNRQSAIGNFLIPHPSSFALKWPNDVLLNGRKVGGILIELAQTPEGEWVALIGVGINVGVREFPPELADTATSLWREGMEVADIGALAEVIGDALEYFAQMRREQGFEVILNRWRTYDATPGRVFETTFEGNTVQGVAAGVESNGALRLRLADGRILPVLSASSLLEKPLK